MFLGGGAARQAGCRMAGRTLRPTLVQWHRSEVLVDKRLRFQARCIALAGAEEVQPLLHALLEDKHLRKATHPAMFAWRTVSPTGQVAQGSDDCGEGGAGARILSVLETARAANVLVVVTRWYGGTPLGPARFRDISRVAHEALVGSGRA